MWDCPTDLDPSLPLIVWHHSSTTPHQYLANVIVLIDSHRKSICISKWEQNFAPFSFLLYQFISHCIYDNFSDCSIVTKIQFSFIYENEPSEKNIKMRCFLFPHCNSAYKSFKLFHSSFGGCSHVTSINLIGDEVMDTNEYSFDIHHKQTTPLPSYKFYFSLLRHQSHFSFSVPSLASARCVL